jgi:hypothetical protein
MHNKWGRGKEGENTREEKQTAFDNVQSSA